ARREAKAPPHPGHQCPKRSSIIQGIKHMARTPKTTSTAVANWEQELEQQAQVAAGMAASTGDAQFFSVRAGQLSFGGMPLPGNQMGVVILDAILENVYYEGEFNPDEPAPPTCFAFARDAALLTPH